MRAETIHRHVPASTEAGASLAPVLALHGTGGDENDLLPLVAEVAPGRAILSPRGAVSEASMNRFFRRFPDGRLDEDDLRRRAGDLAAFVTEAGTRYGLAQPVALGFSNGANIAAAVLRLHPDAFAGAVLLRPMLALRDVQSGPLQGVPVLILSATNDVYASVPETRELAARLEAAGAALEHHVLPAEHGLTPRDVALAHDWFARRAAAEASRRAPPRG